MDSLLRKINQTSLLKEVPRINPVFKITQIKYTLILQNLDPSHFFKIKYINLILPESLRVFYVLFPIVKDF